MCIEFSFLVKKKYIDIVLVLKIDDSVINYCLSYFFF